MYEIKGKNQLGHGRRIGKRKIRKKLSNFFKKLKGGSEG